MITEYLLTNFNAKSKIQVNPNTTAIKIKGGDEDLIKTWVNTKLAEYLRMQYPEQWDDSLNQFMTE